MLSQLFTIEHGYFGTVLSNLAKLHMSGATEESNEKHLAPWSAACQRDGIINTPLSPYIDQELLYNKHLNIDGSKIEGTGFSYELPRVSLELLREVRVKWSTSVHCCTNCLHCLRWWMTM